MSGFGLDCGQFILADSRGNRRLVWTSITLANFTCMHRVRRENSSLYSQEGSDHELRLL